jgi:uncharacterized protein
MIETQKHRVEMLISFLVGLLFSMGIAISGMAQPQNVIGFLDIFGNWNPTLIFVMIGAIPVHMAAYRMIKGAKAPVLDSKFYLPTVKELTPQLMFGATLFGVAWGIAGLCPGPAFVSMIGGSYRAFLFIASMTVGMLLYRRFELKFNYWMTNKKG